MLQVRVTFIACHVSFFAEAPWKFYVIIHMIFASGMRIQTKHRKYKWLQLHVANQNSFSWNGYAKTLWSRVTISVHQSVWRVSFLSSFFEFGIQMVYFLCSRSAVRLLPYRDATERRVSGQREEKRRTNKTHFSSLNLLTVESVKKHEHSSAHSNQAKSAFYWKRVHTQSYISEPCVSPGSVCTCLKHQWRNKIAKELKKTLV